MTHFVRKYTCAFGVAVAMGICNGGISSTEVSLVAKAEAVAGAPVTPVSYAGVARRSTVGAGAPGVGATPGAGAGAPGPGVTPAPGVAPAPGVTPAPGVNTPANRGTPVNRVGVR